MKKAAVFGFAALSWSQTAPQPPANTNKVTSRFDWIKVEILAQGNRVRSAFNGVQVMEWREADLSRVKEGPIGLQLHAWNEAQEVLY